jgi:hypothetical protein
LQTVSGKQFRIQLSPATGLGNRTPSARPETMGSVVEFAIGFSPWIFW